MNGSKNRLIESIGGGPMNKRLLIISYYFAVFLSALFLVFAVSERTRLNLGSAFEYIAAIPENISEGRYLIPFLNGQRIETVLTYVLTVTFPVIVFLSGLTVFSLSFGSISVFMLSLGASAAILEGSGSVKMILLLSLALAGTVLIGVYSADHRYRIKYAAPDIRRLLRQPTTKRYIQNLLCICSFILILTAAITRLPLPD